MVLSINQTILNVLPSIPIFANTYSPFTTEALIPFYPEPKNQPPNAPFTEKVRINVKLVNSAGSRTHHPAIDTGTCGYVVSKDSFPGPVPKDAPVGWEYLSSSKILYSGHWVGVDAYFIDAAMEVKAHFPVLVVDSKFICSKYNQTVDKNICPSTTNIIHEPTAIAVFGVGFGRQHDGQPQGDPDKNPFLNIVSIGGMATNTSNKFRNGYVIGKKGVQIGLTRSNTRGTDFQKLSPGIHHSMYPLDWAPMSACIAVNDTQSCVQGTALIDTGITQSYLTLPAAYPVNLTTATSPSTGATVQALANGSVVNIELGSHSPHVIQDEFVVGDAKGMKKGAVPDVIITTLSDHKAPFINTGRHFFRSWEVTFDAVGGRLGFRRV